MEIIPFPEPIASERSSRIRLTSFYHFSTHVIHFVFNNAHHHFKSIIERNKIVFNTIFSIVKCTLYDFLQIFQMKKCLKITFLKKAFFTIIFVSVRKDLISCSFFRPFVNYFVIKRPKCDYFVYFSKLIFFVQFYC